MDRPATSEGVAPPPQADPGSAGPPATKSSGQVEIKAVTDCWIQVRAADHSIVFSRVLKAGETYRVPRPGLSLRTGNAGALTFAVDGKPAPPIGAIGELKRDVSLDGDALLAGTAVHG
jgi:cytoskeleton protein RodZ